MLDGTVAGRMEEAGALQYELRNNSLAAPCSAMLREGARGQPSTDGLSDMW